MNSTAANGRFGAMAAVPRRQFCANLNVTTPQEVQWKPPLRQAAGTLCEYGGQCQRKTLNIIDINKSLTKTKNNEKNHTNSKFWSFAPFCMYVAIICTEL